MMYDILTSYDRRVLIEEVMVRIQQGWMLIGGSSCVIQPAEHGTAQRILWSQAMIKTGYPTQKMGK